MVIFQTVLVVNLLEESFENYIASEAHHYNPYIFTAVGMVLIFISLYFLFIQLEHWINGFLENTLKAGKSIMGKKVGIFIMFTIVMFVIFYFYAKMWFGIDVWMRIIR